MGIARDLAAELTGGRCPECGTYWRKTFWIDRSKEPPVWVPSGEVYEPCETCNELRKTLPKEEIHHIEIVVHRREDYEGKT
jgi:hypothetical protein